MEKSKPRSIFHSINGFIRYAWGFVQSSGLNKQANWQKNQWSLFFGLHQTIIMCVVSSSAQVEQAMYSTASSIRVNRQVSGRIWHRTMEMVSSERSKTYDVQFLSSWVAQWPLVIQPMNVSAANGHRERTKIARATIFYVIYYTDLGANNTFPAGKHRHTRANASTPVGGEFGKRTWSSRSACCHYTGSYMSQCCIPLYSWIIRVHMFDYAL